MKMNNKEDFDERQIFNRDKYGLHCYMLTLILVLLNSIGREYLGIDFENEFDFILLVLGISAAYYVLRAIIGDSFLPKKWRSKINSFIFIMVIINVMIIIRWYGVEHEFTDIIENKLIYSDLTENFVLQLIAVVMLISFVVRSIQEKRDEKEE